MKVNPLDFMENKKLILSLIKNDPINSKLVYGLSDLGFDAGCYFLHLSETIFSLTGLDGSERRAFMKNTWR